MPRGVYNAGATRWTKISDREQNSLHAGLLGGMRETDRSEVRQNPSLDPEQFPGLVTRFQREREYVTRHAQWREDAIVTREVERQLSLVASLQRVVAGSAGYF